MVAQARLNVTWNVHWPFVSCNSPLTRTWKVNMSPSAAWRHIDRDVSCRRLQNRVLFGPEEKEAALFIFLRSRYGAVISYSRTACFYIHEEHRHPHWTLDWVNRTAGLDGSGEGKDSAAYTGIRIADRPSRLWPVAIQTVFDLHAEKVGINQLCNSGRLYGRPCGVLSFVMGRCCLNL